MLNRSKIVIDVDTPSFPLETAPFKVAQQNLVPNQLCVLRPRQLLMAAAARTTRRTGLFPNGDVRQVSTSMPRTETSETPGSRGVEGVSAVATPTPSSAMLKSHHFNDSRIGDQS
jgi:hypothetical protein